MKPTFDVFKKQAPVFPGAKFALAAGLTALFIALPQAHALQTDVAKVPLQTASSTAVKPNIMFILDNSTSMDETELPEGLSPTISGNLSPGYRSHHCNRMYYNPNVIYTVPKYYNGDPLNTQVNASGTPYPNAASTVFTNASINGYTAGSAVRNLETQFNATNWNTTTYEMWPDGPDAGNSQDGGAYYFEWTGGGAPNCGVTAGWTRRHWSGTTTPAVGPWTAAQKQNFANWFAYYRTRMLLMKYATSKAFLGIDDAVRLGFVTINTGSPVSSSRYLKIDAFTTHAAGHKRLWYDKLLSQTTSGSTPLLRALSRVGRHYGKQTTGINSGMNDDPVQYYCQRNYAILTTDGYWNQDTTEPGVNLSGGNFGSTSNFDGTGDTPPPMRDSSNVGATLADVAMYYYETDLRPNGSVGALGFDVGTGQLAEGPSGVEEDNARHQHMTTFTFGLGVSGTLTYHPDYKLGFGDFTALRAGTKAWPDPYGNSTAQPQTLRRIDDLWHAAVNGRGQYFSASDPEGAAADLQTAINSTLSTPASTGGSSVSSSSPNPGPGEDLIFTAFNKLAEWTGELEAYKIKVIPDSPGDTRGLGLPIGNPVTAFWKAEGQLAARVGEACDNRKIYIFDAGATNKFREFKMGTSACDAGLLPSGAPVTTLLAAEQAHFNQANAIDMLSQRSVMSTSSPNQPALAAGAPLVNYIRGQSGNEDFVAGSSTKFFRGRNGILGDFVNSGATHVGKPFMSYTEALNTGYSAFKTGPAEARTKAVYIAANNGMLHAFRASDGHELFTYIPSMTFPTLFTRAHNNLQHTHTFLLDGTPLIADAYAGGGWKTMLVAPMGRGATGYYALDITDPDVPKAMWEFKWSSTCFPVSQYSDCDLGRSIGAPIVTKHPLTNQWVVLVTSGLNNIDGSNKGKGFLYILDAADGRILDKIGTGAGDATTPSGLSEISIYAPTQPGDNVAARVYGGDTLGNVWRFDLRGDTGLGQVSRLARLTDSFGTPQPVTTKPVVSTTGVPYKALVVVPTGRYLGLTDLTDTNKQTIYTFIDNLLDVASPRSELAQRILTSIDGISRDVSCVGPCTKDPQGWYVDLPDPGERGNVPPALLNGTLVVATNVPTDTACGSGGHSFVNLFAAETGTRVSRTKDVGFKIPDALITGVAFVNFSGTIRMIGTLSNPTNEQSGTGGQYTRDKAEFKKNYFALDVPQGIDDFANRRLSWRELIRQ